MMTQYFDGFLKFSIKESNKFIDENLDYIQELKEELYYRFKHKSFDGWEMDDYHYQRMGSFHFVKNDSNFWLYVTPFFDVANDMLEVEITYAGWGIEGAPSVENLSSNLTGETVRDVEFLYHLMIDTLKKISDKGYLITKLIDRSEIKKENLFSVIVSENDPDTLLYIAEHFPQEMENFTPDAVTAMFKDENDMENFFISNANKWEKALSSLWGKEESEKFFSRMKKRRRGKNMFGI